MNLKLVKASKEYEALILDMLSEWRAFNNAHPEADHSPWAIFYQAKDFSDYMHVLNDIGEHYHEYDSSKVPASTYFALDIERNIMVGACNIRHYLNEDLRNGGGHIGDGVRPSERGKGYGKEIIRLALNECKKLGIKEVLISCHTDNTASRKTILANGGVYEKTVPDHDKQLELYWIKL